MDCMSAEQQEMPGRFGPYVANDPLAFQVYFVLSAGEGKLPKLNNVVLDAIQLLDKRFEARGIRLLFFRLGGATL